MDIRKLQRTIVSGLEDIKAHDIAVFNTEHLSALFERVIIASGTSNRQTKALAAGVREAVRAKGFPVLRTEGEENGEWIIVDCGAAVVHVMQPSIREYYHLEEIWGDKPVRMKLDGSPRRLVKAEEPMAARKAAPRKQAGKTAAERAAPSAKAPTPETVVRVSRKAPGTRARKAPATRSGPTRTVGVKRSSAAAAPAKAVRKAPARKSAVAKVGRNA